MLILDVYNFVTRLSHVSSTNASYDVLVRQIKSALENLARNMFQLEKGSNPRKIGKAIGALDNPCENPIHRFSALSAQMATVSAQMIQSVNVFTVFQNCKFGFCSVLILRVS